MSSSPAIASRFIVVLVCCLAAGVCHGQCRRCSPGTLFQWSYGNSFEGGPDLTAPLVTDRPDFTEASSTVGRGVAQLEIGYTYSFDEEAGLTSLGHSYPEPLLRYGVLADWLELRAAWNYMGEKNAGVVSEGAADLYLGLKIGLTPQEQWLPEMALIPQANVPTGAGDFTSGDVQPGLNWIYGWQVTENISTAGSTQFNRRLDVVTAEAYTEWAQSWTVGYTLTEQIGGYTEWFALMPHSADTARAENYFNGGLVYLLSDNIQLDVRAGTGLNTPAVDYFLGTGVSIRYY